MLQSTARVHGEHTPSASSVHALDKYWFRSQSPARVHAWHCVSALAEQAATWNVSPSTQLEHRLHTGLDAP